MSQLMQSPAISQFIQRLLSNPQNTNPIYLFVRVDFANMLDSQSLICYVDSGHALSLKMDDFVLPPSEKETALVEAIQGVDAGNLLDYPKVNRKEPVNNGMLLLANEEFDKETGGYQSESEDAEDEKLEDEPSPIQTTSKKIKASKTSRSSKKKKHRTMMDVVEDEVVTEDNNINNDKFCPMKIIKPSKENGGAQTILIEVKSPPKLKRVMSGDEGEVRDEICNIDDDKSKTISKKKIKPNEEANMGDAETSDKKSGEYLEDNVQGIEQASTTPDGDKKGPSRSARRKKAKRQWKRELTKISKKHDTDTHLEGTNDHPKGHEKSLTEEEERNCNGNTDTQLVACVVKPGYIRFELLNEATVVVTSTVQSSLTPEKIVFHVITDKKTYAGMHSRFALNPISPAIIEVKGVHQFDWLTRDNAPVLEAIENHNGICNYYHGNHISGTNVGDTVTPRSFSSKLQARIPKYISLLNHLHIYLPELSSAFGRLVISSDGVWDALSTESALECSRGLAPESAAAQIVKVRKQKKNVKFGLP
uniref:Hexosyltransferase n=1 Tax=Lactuca sativa TaxID=4236 RepID=A0A9R1VW34_LACSA|nr:hypothetical protein LSAT_V11C400168910 [Lactuca sativa]